MTTRVMFTAKADHRFAWFGNDAEDQVDILHELLYLLDGATTSIELSSMTFNFTPGGGAASDKVKAIADKLAAKATAGVSVRIVGNAGHRWQRGYLLAQSGPVQLVDQYVSALVARVSFQTAAAPVPAGFMVDSGAVFGPKGAISYGWDTDVTTRIAAHGAVPAHFTSALLGQCYARKNQDGPRVWSIQLTPNAHYYVRVVCGEAAFGSNNVIRVQGQTVFSRPNPDEVYTFSEAENAGPGEFVVSTVDGGEDAAGQAKSRRVQADATGMITVSVGKVGEAGFSSLDYVEIYAASALDDAGDNGTDPTRVQRRGIHHAKFIVVDGAKVWFGSHNITPVDPTEPDVRSEDAILTDDAGVVAAFRAEFNRWWGAPAGTPVPASARTLMFKAPAPSDHMVPGIMLPGPYAWRLRFSPSTTVAPGHDMFVVVDDFLASATRDVELLVEQITNGGDFGMFEGATALIAGLATLGAAGVRVHGVLGNEGLPAGLSGPGLDVVVADGVHDKAALVDVLRDNPTTAIGRLLCGSMNWSQGALHTNDEQTVLIDDPAIANQYLQLMAGMFARVGNPLSRPVDCVIVLDRSGSMNATLPGSAVTLMAAARAAAKVFLSILDLTGGHRVGLVPFGAAVDVAALLPPTSLSTSLAALSNAVDNVQATGTLAGATCFGLPLQEAWSQLTGLVSPAPRRVVVFLTDGNENAAPNADTAYPTLAANGVEIHTTSFGVPSQDTSGPNAILAEMAAASGASFSQVDADDLRLRKRFADVARDAQNLVTILDPTWLLAPGSAVRADFPVDLDRGRLVVAWLWSASAVRGLDRVALRTPTGITLLGTSPGVVVRRAAGHEVWHVDLAAVAKNGPTLGRWTAQAVVGHLERQALRVDLCVYADDLGCARMRAEVRDLGTKGHELCLRVFDGLAIAKDFKAELTHFPPGKEARASRGRRIELRDLSQRGRPWRGVLGAHFDPLPGAHAVQIVVRGTVHCPKSNAPVAFAREQSLAWYVRGPDDKRARVDLTNWRRKRR